MEDKIGVFICTGYGIAEALDIDALCKVASDEFKIPFCQTVDSCEGSGLETMKAEIAKAELNKVLVAGIRVDESVETYTERAVEEILEDRVNVRDLIKRSDRRQELDHPHVPRADGT